MDEEDHEEEEAVQDEEDEEHWDAKREARPPKKVMTDYRVEKAKHRGEMADGPAPEVIVCVCCMSVRPRGLCWEDENKKK